MNCLEFKKQFEDGARLNAAAAVHLESCAGCRTFRTEEMRLTEMFRTLPKVAAPKDFEFGFRAKLAGAQSKKQLSPVRRTIRYLLPLTAAALILGFVVFSWNLFLPAAPNVAESERFRQDLTPTDAKKAPETPAPAGDLSAGMNDQPKQAVETNEAAALKDESVVPRIAETAPPPVVKKESDRERIISRDSTTEADERRKVDNALGVIKPINPPGIDPNKPIDPPPPVETASFTAQEILLQLGIETTAGAGGLKVNSVRPNSAGETSGVEVGDIVTAIDGQMISEKPMQKRTVRGKTLKVRRNERELEISIRN